MLRLMRQQKKETYYLWIALFLLLLYVSPLFILKEDAHIRVHDNLDSNIAWYKVPCTKRCWNLNYRGPGYGHLPLK